MTDMFEPLLILWDPWVKLYYQRRYGRNWLWYYANWETNREFLP